ncbi:MAG TPA: GNAT family N-acetyltransferase [Acidimicrobiia bacterium]
MHSASPSRNAHGSVELLASPVARDLWREIADHDPEVVASQLPEWCDALPPHWVDVSRAYRASDGRRVVVPMVRRAGSTRIPVDGSYPHGLGYGGAVAEGGVTQELLTAVLADIAAERRMYLSLWPNPVQADRWETAIPSSWLRIPRCAHVLDVSGGVDAVWARMPGNGRRGVRRAERAGVEVETDDAGRLLPVFFDLFDSSQRRWAAASHEPLWLARWRARHDTVDTWQRISRAVAGRCSVSVARVNGTPVASIIVLHGPNAHYTHGAMRKDEAGPTYANYALHWKAIVDAVGRGAGAYHMGESGSSATLARFKEQFGATARHYAEYRYERLPLTRLDTAVRSTVKRAVGFRDAGT